MPRPNDSHPSPELVVPLFPLPNVVLFPQAVLPLHIFEERYKEMMSDALESDQRIAMALLKPGWEKNYYARPAINPVVCVGRILQHERLPDGRFNMLLQGEMRGKVRDERKSGPYRVARIEPPAAHPIMEVDLSSERQKLVELIEEIPPAVPMWGELRKIVESPLPTDDVADLISFHFLEDIELKQSLLSEWDVRKRVNRVIHAVKEAQAHLPNFPPGLNEANLN